MKQLWKLPGYKERHPRWNGGITKKPYCELFTPSLRQKVRSNFNNKCFLCGKTEKENKRELTVHHVTYNKKVLCDGDIPLFVTLCNKCHPKTNIDREYWEIFFKYGIALHTNGTMKCF
jgi:hypothetical protein